MIAVSDAFKEAMKSRRDFRCRAHVIFANGQEIDIPESLFSLSGNTIRSGNGTDGLPLGEVVGRSISLELMNQGQHFTLYQWVGAKINLILVFNVGDADETVDMGVFTVTEPETQGYVLAVTAHDDTYKTDKAYDSPITYPNTLSNIFSDACFRCGIPYESATFLNSDFEVLARPSNVTYRQVLGMVAMLAGGNVIINRDGNAEIKTWNFSPSGEETLGDWYSFNAEAVNHTITGISATVSEYVNGRVTASTLLEGEDGYVISLENQMMIGKESEALQRIREVFVGKSIRIFDGEHAPNPLVEFMDNVIVGSKTVLTNSVVTDIEFNFLGTSVFSNSASTEARVNSTYKVKENLGKKADDIYNELMAGISRTEEGLSLQVAKLNELASVTMTKSQIELAISGAIDGIDGIDTKTGVVVDVDGVKVYREGDSVENRITHGGMYVRRNAGESREDVLVADEDGVNALNLTARKYLIIGENSRFEDYVDDAGKKRTACFWIGG